MQYKFTVYSHPNILATHKTTLEFTKDNELTLNGDCIVGVKADFDLNKLKELIKKTNSKKITITMSINSKIREKINAELNPNFSSSHEMVIRKTDFVSERTFAVKADKAAYDISREAAGILKNPDSHISVTIISH
jgi:hypothetical protein